MLTFLVVASLVVYYLYHELWAKRRGLPPGPMPIPFFGNYQMLGKTHPQVVMLELSKVYGSLFTVWIGNEPNIIMTDGDMMRKYIGGKNAEAFSGRVTNYVFDYLNGGGGEGIVFVDGPKWREQRRFTLNVLRNFGFGRNIMEGKIIEEAEDLVDFIKKKIAGGRGADGINLEIPFGDCSGSVIGNITLGHRFQFDDPKFQTLKNMLDENLRLLSSPESSLIGRYGWLRFIPPFSKLWATFLEHNDIYMKWLMDEVNAHKQDFHPDDEPTDYTSAYLMEMERRRKAGEDMSHFSTLQLAIVIGDLWVAAMETVATTLRWAVLFLTNRPELQIKVQKEIDDYFGNDTRPVTMSDRANLPFTAATLTETQRVGNIFPVNLQHRVTEDIDVEGYHFPKNTIVVPQIAAVHEDPKYFNNPEQFQPYRFLDENNRPNKKTEEIVPFSMGKRVCLGQALAKMELFLIFVTLMRNFKFSVAPGDEFPLPEEPALGFTRAPQSFKVLVETRVPGEY